MDSWSSIGTWLKTKRRRPNPRAVGRCSAIGFRSSTLQMDGGKRCGLHAGRGQSAGNVGEGPIANVVKKHSISSQLAQKLVDEAGANGVSGAPRGKNDIVCARAALARVSDGVPTD